jgi:succinyl-diaminopimelate desuccinylase
MPQIDPIALTQALIRCPSVTPDDAGARDTLRAAGEPPGFTSPPRPVSAAGTPDIENLYARGGSGGRHFCFAGHTDVVPPGDPRGWTVEPFKAEIIGGQVYGRGAADMKGAIAAFSAPRRRAFSRAAGAGSTARSACSSRATRRARPSTARRRCWTG